MGSGALIGGVALRAARPGFFCGRAVSFEESGAGMSLPADVSPSLFFGCGLRSTKTVGSALRLPSSEDVELREM